MNELKLVFRRLLAEHLALSRLDPVAANKLRILINALAKRWRIKG